MYVVIPLHMRQAERKVKKKKKMKTYEAQKGKQK